MCFRPAAASSTPICPNCGKEVPIVGGVVLKKCPFCKADMPELDASAAPGMPNAAPAGAPAAPKAPGVPGAPGAPRTPGAPGVPGQSS